MKENTALNLEWGRIPTSWISNKEKPLLKSFDWSEKGSTHIAALMLYIALNQQSPGEKNKAAITYDQLCHAVSLSRAMVSAGIKHLEEVGLIQIKKNGRANIYQIVGRDKGSHWAKLPVRRLYDEEGIIDPFKHFNLRKRTELNALKLYLLIIAFRDNKKNHTTISYEKIMDYTGISRGFIRGAISFLINLEMIDVDRQLIDGKTEKRMNVYWTRGISFRHAGNSPDFISDL
jgi:predicted transcriptional regulator